MNRCVTIRSLFFMLCSIACVVASWSCKKQNLNNAGESLVGTWKVTEIYSEQKDASGIHSDGRHWENGDLGFFTFGGSSVTFSYTRLDTLYEASSAWTLSREKVNEGFHKVEKYTLTFDNREYNCRFGDGTSDAEKNADKMVLTYETATTAPNFVLTVVKE